jgi:hypothetical protein
MVQGGKTASSCLLIWPCCSAVVHKKTCGLEACSSFDNGWLLVRLGVTGKMRGVYQAHRMEHVIITLSWNLDASLDLFYPKE